LLKKEYKALEYNLTTTGVELDKVTAFWDEVSTFTQTKLKHRAFLLIFALVFFKKSNLLHFYWLQLSAGMDIWQVINA